MLIREEQTLVYYYNSLGVEEKTISNGAFVQKYLNDRFETISNDLDIRMFDVLWEHIYDNDFELLKSIMSKYNEICNDYRKYLNVVLEIKVQQNIKNIITNKKSLTTSFKLYAFNICITNMISKKRIEKGFGGRNDVKYIMNLEDEIVYLINCALISEKCKGLTAGFYDVILDPEATGLLVHEIIGHCFEADNNILPREIIHKKAKLAIEEVNIVDDPLLDGGFGSFDFDDEGTIAQQTYLIRNGCANSLLTSKATALNSSDKAGNARAISYEYKPIVRMSNTYMLPNNSTSKADLFNSTNNGLYFKGCQDSVGGKDFFLKFRECFIVSNKNVSDRIDDMMIVGDVFRTLKQISMVANDLIIDGGGTGGCGKMGQWPLPVSAGGPHIKLSNVFVVPASMCNKSAVINMERKNEV